MIRKSTKLNTPLKKGLYGEGIVRVMLKRYPYVFYNVKIDNTQIDHILVCSKGIFVLETKSLKGKISGTTSSKLWTQEFRRSTTFLNPLKQNEYHINVLLKYLSEYKDYFKSVIVFAGEAIIPNIENVVKVNALNKYINDHEDILSDEQVVNIYNKIKTLREKQREGKKMYETNKDR